MFLSILAAGINPTFINKISKIKRRKPAKDKKKEVALGPAKEPANRQEALFSRKEAMFFLLKHKKRCLKIGFFWRTAWLSPFRIYSFLPAFFLCFFSLLVGLGHFLVPLPYPCSYIPLSSSYGAAGVNVLWAMHRSFCFTSPCLSLCGRSPQRFDFRIRPPTNSL